MNKPLLKEIRSYVLITIAIFSAGMGIKGYLLSSHFIDGGVTGISMLLNDITGWPLSILIAVINLPFIVLGYYQMGLKFAVKSSIAIAGLSLCLAFVPYPDVTPDKLLTALFGGFFLGIGIGLAIRAEAVLDGTEIAALLVSKTSSILRVADVILILNVVIFGTAAFFLGVERASYYILTYFAASKTIEFLLNGLEEYTGVTIVSRHHADIRTMIAEQLNRGVTAYSGKGGFGKGGEHQEEHDILFTVVTRLEVGKLQNLIKGIDKNAFIIQHSINDIHGGMVKPRGLH
ncbi:MAG: YitT family protein [Flaviaesturariibacter sp.]|nr:YitT family protein [Flaviaesturariibacter sp.]